MKQKTKHNTKRNPFPWPLLWLCLLFFIPLCTASMLYIFRDNIPFKIIPNGQLLNPPLSADSLGFILPNESKGKWQLIYSCSKTQTKECESQYDLVKRIHLSLGKDQTRIKLSYAYSESFMPAFTKQNLKQDLKQDLKHSLLNNNQVLLFDPHGFLVLYYTSPIEKPKGMLEDIRRLLKYSHIG